MFRSTAAFPPESTFFPIKFSKPEIIQSIGTRRSTSPSTTSILQFIFHVFVELTRNRYSIGPREVIIYAKPFSRPRFSRIHNSNYSFKKGCGVQIAFFLIIRLPGGKHEKVRNATRTYHRITDSAYENLKRHIE